MRGIELTPEHPVDRVADLAARAEDAGFDTAFVSCHYNNRDPFAALARVADATGSMRLGPGVANPFEIHPVRLAGQAATLDELSGGRAVFGVGPGDPSTLRNLGVDDERGLRPVLEAFEAARDLWRGERIDHDGTFAAASAGLNFEPPQGASIPVYVGGEGPHMCRMAGKRADGLLFNGSHPDDLAWARKRVEEGIDQREDGGATAAGDGAAIAAGDGAATAAEERFDLAAFASVSVGEDADAAREAARPPVAFIAAGAAPPALERHGIDPETAERIGDHISTGAFDEAFAAVTPAMIDALAVAGDPETVTERFDALLDHADGVVAGAPLGPELDRAIELAGRALEDASDG